MNTRSRSEGREFETDARWMRQALALAEGSIGLASPNPRVGCVLVQSERVVGQGAHIYARLDHAEIVALREAGEQARGATAYVTLEPCAHVGRTGPCADALIQAGLARVVVATVDPFPQVNGRGIERLRSAGIEVTVGVLMEQARQINEGFARYARSRLPFVTLKAGLSLDGRIAPAQPGPVDIAAGAVGSAAGSVTYLTSPHSLLAVQRMRHASDAVLTGIGTVLADNPLLTDRSGLPRRRPLLRVVLDSALRLPLDSRLVRSLATPEETGSSIRNSLLVYTSDAASAKAEALRAAGVLVEEAPALVVGQGAAAAEEQELARLSSRSEPPAGFATTHGTYESPVLEGQLDPQADHPIPEPATLDLGAVIASLAQRHGILNLLAECGSRLNRALLSADLVDKLCLFYAPMLLGDHGAPFLGGPGSLHPELSRTTLARSGDDFRLEAYLRDPWA